MAIISKKKKESKKQSSNSDGLDGLLKGIEAKFGKGSAMVGTNGSINNIKKIPLGIIGLDKILGGGIPVGRIMEIYGPESSGKTTLMLTLAASVQRDGGKVAFIDAEHALDVRYAQALGVNVEEMLISQPDSGEQALEMVDYIVASGEVDLVIVDSVAALTPRAELDGSMGDSHMGLQARLMGQALRKLTASINKNNCTVAFINQLRSKIGVMFGSPETTSGGNALKFYCSVRLDIRRIGALKVGDQNIGNKVRIKTVKNKVAPPFQEGEFVIMFGKGFDKMEDLLTNAIKLGIVNKAGAWLNYEDLKAQGSENFKRELLARPEVVEEIKSQVIEALDIAPVDRLASNQEEDLEE